MKIATKLFISYAVMVAILVGTASLIIFGTANIQGNVDEMYDSRVVPLTELAQISQLAENTRVQTVSAIINRSEEPANIAERNLDSIDVLSNQYAEKISGSEEREVFEEFHDAWIRFAEIERSNIELIRNRQFDDAEVGISQGGVPFQVASLYLSELIATNIVESDNLYSDSVRSYEFTFILLISVVAVAAVGIIIYAFFQARSIVKPITSLGALTKQVADGDLTVDTSKLAKRKDEIGVLASDFQAMTQNLRKIIEEVLHSSEQVAASSQQLSASSEEASKATNVITESIQEIATGADHQVTGSQTLSEEVSQVSSGLEQIAGSMETVNSFSDSALHKAQSGEEVISNAVKQMGTIQNKTNDSTKVINSLGQKSGEIEGIISLITNLAEQTSLLALNAAIEAARAGEEGRGFAVVADEVRKLAEQSGDSAEKVNTLIQDIQAGIEQSMTAMHDGQLAVDDGITLVNQAGGTFGDITGAINDVTIQVQEVSAAVQQITASTATMVESSEGMSEVAQESASNTQSVAASAQEQYASMEEITASAQTLSDMAENLQESVKIFKL